MRYAKGVIITLLAKGMAIPIGIASSVITARYLGPEGRGVLAILFVLQGVTFLVGGLGLHTSGTYFISRNKDDASRIASNILSSALMQSLVVVALFFLIGVFRPAVLIGDVDVYYLNIFLLIIPFTFIVHSMQGTFLAYQKIYEFNLLELFPRLLQLILFIVVLVFLGLGTVEAVLCFVFATVVGGTVYLYQVRRVVPLRLQFNLGLFKEMIRYGLKNYVSSLLLFLVARINLMLINQQLGTSEAGIYSIALQIMDVIYLFPSTIALLLFPKVSENVQDPGILTAKVLRFSTATMVTLSVGILLLGRPAIEMMFGPAFTGSVLPLYWLTPGLVSLALATIILNDLAGRGLPVIVPIASAIALLVNLVIVIPSMEGYGLVGPAAATSVAHCVLLVIVTVYFMKRTKMGMAELFLLKLSDVRSITLRG